jgi:hypothetical protein
MLNSVLVSGKLENSSVGGSSSYSNNFGISSANNKMNVNSSVSSKMLHNLPPGVANMIPQYMMTGAGAGNHIYRVVQNKVYDVI